MTSAAVSPPADTRVADAWPFLLAVMLSAALVFTVQPLVARLLLPLLGGAPAVWAVSLAVFQGALLVGYAYAHALQRIASLRGQAIVHLLVLLAAGAATLPLDIGHGLGDPPSGQPTAWLVMELLLTIGAPFAALSATAPLMQAWYAGSHAGRRAYGLYAASNAASLAALLAYPLLIEPLTTLSLQRALWTGGYLAFVALAAVTALRLRTTTMATERPRPAPPPTWRRRFVWMLLAAAPSSLLAGVTTHLATDIASAPFLWVPPLALYLLSFVIAFQSKPWLDRRSALVLQAVAVPGAAALLPFPTIVWPALALSHLFAFFLTALVCHQALAQRKPPTSRLTDFYLWIALGGVLGGAFNAFVAPQIFERIWEYPLVMILAALARPWGRGRPPAWLLGVLTITIVAALATALLAPDGGAPSVMARLGLAAACAGAVVLARRGPLFALALLCVFAGAERLGDREGYIFAERSFFGVHRIGEQTDPELGRVRTLINGSTLHGAQVMTGPDRCRPLAYYAPAGPIGQIAGAVRADGGPRSIGVLGLGAGTLATYGRPGDSVRFYEIDPVTARLAGPDGWFSYLSACSRARARVVLGDARVSLRREPDATFDLLFIDAFSSDTVPTHLLTTEALTEYLRVLRPDGVMMLHLSNRNLALTPYAAAAVRAAGGAPMVRLHTPLARRSPLVESPAEVMLVARDPAALAAVTRGGGWAVPPADAQAWTDERSSVVGALWRRFADGG